ncbi:MAG: hypothetical protein HGB19_08965 [Chlorobiales bacterium]|nr:hypothetical protein [Chlorobiales bacterium]
MDKKIELSPRWTRLVKVEELEAGAYYVDAYCSPLPSEELRENNLDEKPILYAFAIFNQDNQYVLSYALEIRKAYRLNDEGEEEEYVGCFLEAFCPNSQFSCKTYKDAEPDFDAVKNTVLSYIHEYDAVKKMLEYDQETLLRQSNGKAPANYAVKVNGEIIDDDEKPSKDQ